MRSLVLHANLCQTRRVFCSPQQKYRKTGCLTEQRGQISINDYNLLECVAKRGGSR